MKKEKLIPPDKETGVIGSMSLCQHCSEMLIQKLDKDFATLIPIKKEKKEKKDVGVNPYMSSLRT